MDAKMAELLEKLASKLGVATEVLWGALLRQARIDAVVSLIQYVTVAGCVVFLIKRSSQIKAAIANADIDDGWTMMSCVGWSITVIFVAIAAVIMVADLSNFAASIFNPEYWALRQLLKSAGK